MNMLVNLERTLAERLAADAERRAQRRALSIAMRRFAKLHAIWYEALFDESFVRRVFAETDGPLEADTLAREWTRQFRYRDVRKRERDVRQLVPVAQSLLRLQQQARLEMEAGRRGESPGSSSSGRPEPTPC